MRMFLFKDLNVKASLLYFVCLLWKYYFAEGSCKIEEKKKREQNCHAQDMHVTIVNRNVNILLLHVLRINIL